MRYIRRPKDMITGIEIDVPGMDEFPELGDPTLPEMEQADLPPCTCPQCTAEREGR